MNEIYAEYERTMSVISLEKDKILKKIASVFSWKNTIL
jgi:hypothetical protein